MQLDYASKPIPEPVPVPQVQPEPERDPFTGDDPDPNPSDFFPPLLRVRCITHYLEEGDPESGQKGSMMKMRAELEWTVWPTTLDTFPETVFSYQIKENIHFAEHDTVADVKGAFEEMLCPLEVGTKYEFQIRMFSPEMPEIPHSEWSKPLSITTPSPPKVLPPPSFLHVTGLVPDAVGIRFDPGFAPSAEQSVEYVVKEYLQYGNHDHVAKYENPIGQLAPLEPGTKYQVTVYTQCDDLKSAESAVLELTTPGMEVHSYSNYKPLPPNNIEQTLFEYGDFRKAVLMWSLPPDTFGEYINYVILDLPQVAEYHVPSLPCYLPLPMNDVTIRIVTVAVFNGQEFNSDPIAFVLRAHSQEREQAIAVEPEQKQARAGTGHCC